MPINVIAKYFILNKKINTVQQSVEFQKYKTDKSVIVIVSQLSNTGYGPPQALNTTCMRRRKDVTHICMYCFGILFHSCIRFSRSWPSFCGTGLFLLIRRYSSSQRFSITFRCVDLDGQSKSLTFLFRSNVKIALTSACVTSYFISSTAKSLSCKDNRANQCFSVV